MFELSISIAINAILLFGGYIASVFANAIYIDPEEIQTIFPELSVGRKKQLEKFTSNPRAFFQVAFLVRISSALTIGILTLLIAEKIASYRIIPDPAVYFLVIAFFWMATTALFIYLPRLIRPEQAKTRLVRFLPLMNLIYLLFTPAIDSLGRLAARKGATDISEEQKDDIVERAIETLAESAGITEPIIEEDEKEMIHQIFQLDVTEVEEIMVPRVNITAFEKSTDLKTINETVGKFGFSRYPVFDSTIDNIIGMIKVKDLLQLSEQNRQHFILTDHMRDPIRVSEHRKIDQLLADFKRAKIHLAIVIDEFGGTAGLVTLEDILEEIVGEIEDEDDTPDEQEIKRLDNGNLEVSGACPLENLADALGLELELTEFETVGGLIYDLVGSIPSEGAALSWQNSQLRVLRIEGQRITRVLVIPGS
ncbi:MAG: HlyC/CorC family transporter [FCB group bacterium]|nr:HlyC/CorC family transporter [FCB group bacterium]